MSLLESLQACLCTTRKKPLVQLLHKAIFADLLDFGLTGMLHYKEISYEENAEDLKKFKKNDVLAVKILEIKDDHSTLR